MYSHVVQIGKFDDLFLDFRSAQITAIKLCLQHLSEIQNAKMLAARKKGEMCTFLISDETEFAK